MKKYLLALLIFVSPLMAQETTNNKKTYSPHISIFSTIYGITDFKGSNLPMLAVGLDWSVGKKIYYYGKFQVGYRFGDFKNAPESFLSPISVQFNPLGIGGYLFDNRDVNSSKGWSIIMNFSLGIASYYGFQGGFYQWATEQGWGELKKAFYAMGAFIFVTPEISLYMRYHINKFSAVQLGFNISSHIGEPNQSLLYGFTFGFTF
ncbi:MAG: hypothetical protein ACRCV0_06220 [Brevinema sp.]